jgi:GNAT superfamily N-acetyltransferase
LTAVIREIDARVCPEADLLELYAIEQSCLVPGEPSMTEAERLAYLRHPPATEERHHWLADGGFASLHIHSPRATFLNLGVRPELRRTGIGSALLDVVVARARDRGVHAISGGHATAAGAAFARQVGASDGQRLVFSQLHLPGAVLSEPTVPEGWRVVTWLERVPEGHLDAYVLARAAMDDAPADEGMEFPAASAESVRAMEQALAARDREMRVTVALADDGEIGAFTELRLTPGSSQAVTDDTGTVATHRRKGLARAVKLESLRRLRDDHAEVETVITTNAEENAAMRGLNAIIGFEPVVTTTLATLPVAR